MLCCFFFFNDPVTTAFYTYGHTLSLHDALPILARCGMKCEENGALRGLSPRKSRATKQVARSGPPQGGLAQKRHDGVDRSLHSTTMRLTLFWSWRFLLQATAMCLMGPDPSYQNDRRQRQCARPHPPRSSIR